MYPIVAFLYKISTASKETVKSFLGSHERTKYHKTETCSIHLHDYYKNSTKQNKYA